MQSEGMPLEIFETSSSASSLSSAADSSAFRASCAIKAIELAKQMATVLLALKFARNQQS